VVGGEKFFTSRLAAQAPGNKAGLVVVRGTVATSDGSRRVGAVNVSESQMSFGGSPSILHHPVRLCRRKASH
jgi:hypothetical protein